MKNDKKMSDDEWFKIIVIILLFLLIVFQLNDCSNSCLSRSTSDVYWELQDVKRELKYTVKYKLDSIDRSVDTIKENI